MEQKPVPLQPVMMAPPLTAADVPSIDKDTRKMRKSTVPNRSLMSEKQIADFRQGRFVPDGSRGKSLLENLYDGELTRRSLYSFTTLLAALAGIKLPRDFTRRKDLLIKWLDDNYDKVQPYAQFFKLYPQQ